MRPSTLIVIFVIFHPLSGCMQTIPGEFSTTPLPLTSSTTSTPSVITTTMTSSMTSTPSVITTTMDVITTTESPATTTAPPTTTTAQAACCAAPPTDITKTECTGSDYDPALIEPAIITVAKDGNDCRLTTSCKKVYVYLNAPAPENCYETTTYEETFNYICRNNKWILQRFVSEGPLPDRDLYKLACFLG